MDTFASLFDEASRDVEAEGRERIVTSATQAATSQCWPFLALAQSEAEFGHRLALVEDRLTAIASEHGLSYEEVAAPLRSGFEAVLEAREASTGPKAPEDYFENHQCEDDGDGKCKHCAQPIPEDLRNREASAAGAQCKNCGHANPEHRRGGLCECGCDAYQPTAKTSAIRAPEEYRRGPSFNPSSLSDLNLHSPGYHRETQYTEGYDDAFQGQGRKPGGYGSRDKTLAYEHGYQHGLSDLSPDRKKSSLAYDAHLASLHQALMEGQDPLAWVQQQNGSPSPANAEKPGGHMTTQVFEGEPGSTYDRAMAQGGGTGTPENSGGHTTAPATRQASQGWPQEGYQECEHRGGPYTDDHGKERCSDCGLPWPMTKKSTREPHPFR